MSVVLSSLILFIPSLFGLISNKVNWPFISVVQSPPAVILFSSPFTINTISSLWYPKGNSKIPFSFHNTYKSGKASSLAIDIIDSRYGWESPADDLNYQFWTDLGDACKANGLDWGGDWQWRDVAHCESPSMTVAQARAQSKPDISKEDWEWIQSKLG